jgi:molecular chaperone Hsp33
MSRGAGKFRAFAMSASADAPAPEGLDIRTYFVRGRNALVARADFGELFVDYYLHQGQHGYQHIPAHDGLLKEALAALALHCASRPWNEAIAWTIHFQQPLLNLFLTGDNRRGWLVGQIFTENVKQDGEPRFISDLVREGDEPRRSVVDLSAEVSNSFQAVERYYTNSEQRPARFFHLDGDDYAMVAAQPDCDVAWLEALDVDAVKRLDEDETLSLLEERRYRWHCGCSEPRMLQMLAPIMRADPESLFGQDEKLRMSCPRCGARYLITREALEGYLASEEKAG